MQLVAFSLKIFIWYAISVAIVGLVLQANDFVTVFMQKCIVSLVHTIYLHEAH